MPVEPVPGVLDSDHGGVAATNAGAAEKIVGARRAMRHAARLTPGSAPQNRVPRAEAARHAACAAASAKG